MAVNLTYWGKKLGWADSDLRNSRSHTDSSRFVGTIHEISKKICNKIGGHETSKFVRSIFCCTQNFVTALLILFSGDSEWGNCTYSVSSGCPLRKSVIRLIGCNGMKGSGVLGFWLDWLGSDSHRWQNTANLRIPQKRFRLVKFFVE